MFTDAEIANTVLTTLSGSLSFIYYGMLQSANSSIAQMYLNFFNDTARHASILLELSKDSSWINVPPTMINVKQ